MAVEVEIYATDYCPYCVRAKKLLHEKGVDFVEIDVAKEPHRRAEMENRANGRRTVPQIFIDGFHVGGCDDLYELEGQGKLNSLLKVEA